MKFRFYITDTFEGSIEGTNDEEKARALSGCEDFFVLDSEAGLWLSETGDIEVKDMTKS